MIERLTEDKKPAFFSGVMHGIMLALAINIIFIVVVVFA